MKAAGVDPALDDPAMSRFDARSGARSFDVVVIGAGLAGAAAARISAQQGARVAILEREAVAGMHSSGRNAAMVRSRVAQPAWSDLAWRGAALHRQGFGLRSTPSPGVIRPAVLRRQRIGWLPPSSAHS